MKSAISILLAAGMLAACQTGPHANGPIEGAAINDFMIVNRGSYALAELQLRPTGEKAWSENILYFPVLPAEQVIMDISNEINVCRWDVRFADVLGHEEVDREVDLCSGSSVVFDGGA